jgi:hypothetical protein
MIKCYIKSVCTTQGVNKNLIGNFTQMIFTKEEPAEEHLEITWDNLTEIYSKYGLCLPFNVWNLKKGRKISFFHSSFLKKETWDIKEWKQDNIDMNINVLYQKYKPSMKTLLNCSCDSALVLKYMKENSMI